MFLERYNLHIIMYVNAHNYYTKLMYSFHNKLKISYLNGKVNRRIDFLIDALLKIEKDCFFKQMSNRRLQCLNRREIKEANRHERGVAIKADYVTVSTHMYVLVCAPIANLTPHLLFRI